jgi:hypothetical protein
MGMLIWYLTTSVVCTTPAALTTSKRKTRSPEGMLLVFRV